MLAEMSRDRYPGKRYYHGTGWLPEVLREGLKVDSPNVNMGKGEGLDVHGGIYFSATPAYPAEAAAIAKGNALTEMAGPEAAVVYGTHTHWCANSLYDEDRMRDEYREVLGIDSDESDADFEDWLKKFPRMKIGRHEGWAFTADEYLMNGPLFIIQENTGGNAWEPIIQFQPSTGETMDADGREVDVFPPDKELQAAIKDVWWPKPNRY